MRLLLTRPEPDAARTAEALRNRGHQVLVAPLLRMEFVPAASLGLGPWAGILVTSANAMRATAKHERRDELLDLLLIAVGARTAEVAREHGFTAVNSSSGNVHDLIALAFSMFKGSKLPLLYLAGEDQSADIADVLGSRGIKVRTVVVYRMGKVDTFPKEVIDALLDERIDGVLHYSRRTAEAYVICADAADRRKAAMTPVHYCLSREIAAPLQSAGATAFRIAARPEETALFQEIDLS